LSLLMRSGELSPGYLRNNAPRLVPYAICAIFNIRFLISAAHRYAGRSVLAQIARGCGSGMNFNAAFCLLPMMRLLISELRRLAIEELRRRRPFGIFSLTHSLGVLLVALLLIHSKNRWKWFLVGGTGHLFKEEHF